MIHPNAQYACTAPQETAIAVSPRLFTARDLLLNGAAVARFGSGLSDEVMEALSWVFLNRRVARNLLKPELQPETAAPDWREGQLGEPLSAENTRAISILADVVAQMVTGHGPDPTMGATRFHAHHEAPSWAGAMQLTAIIGPYLFYLDRKVS